MTVAMMDDQSRDVRSELGSMTELGRTYIISMCNE
jgi:hypothetical protein